MRQQLFLFFYLALGFSFSFSAQSPMENEINRILKVTPRSIVKYAVPQKNNTIALPTSFNNAQFLNVSDLATLKDKVVLRIELIYTTYRKSETFDQHALNRKRLQALFTIAPNTAQQAGIEWVLIAQSGCTDAAQGPTFFHGLVITYRDQPTALLTTIETQFLRDAMAGKVPAFAYETYVKKELEKVTVDSAGKESIAKEPVIQLPQFPGGERTRIDYFTRNIHFPGNAETSPQQVVVQFIVDKDGKITNVRFPDLYSSSPFHDEVLRFVRNMPAWTPGSINNKRTDCMVQFAVDFTSRGSIIPSPLEIYAIDAPPTPTSKGVDYSKLKPNGSFKSIAETLNQFRWNNTVLVCDVTGSMAPYNVQVMDFLKANFTKKDTSFRAVVFFNDGDGKKDKVKKNGSVGGVYVKHPTSFDQAFESLIEVMNLGNGGDLPENNIEALLAAEKACPTCSATVMIADNYANPRDMELATELTKPVWIIVCGTSPILNERYLNLARMTKGKVYFNNREIKDLHLFEDGATVQVGKETFVLKNGKFIRRM
jgi:hypothetical protein